ncbi:cell wall biogenesis protein mhp1 [Teratosphaeria destructans]|uniref:Cell wall biogenesis protein mhp1 n=1 Tax=Teratosphaeria destructans TaxID=418781 RepID=A0A9W7W094_9PEZI|nr:cell wall biogenesis protein mhp1 [Teratosphaeria destructans]
MLHDGTTLVGEPWAPEPRAPIDHSASSAKWRRPPEDYFTHGKQLSGRGQRTMEELHGVDVSWLHHPGKDHHHHRRPSSGRSSLPPRPPPKNAPPTPAPAAHQRQGIQANGRAANGQQGGLRKPHNVVTPAQVAEPARDSTNAHPSTPPIPPSTANGKNPSKSRPSLLLRTSSNGKKEGEGRRSSWLSNIGSKLSSSSQTTTPERPGPQPIAQGKQTAATSPGPGEKLATHMEEAEKVEPYIPSKPKDGNSSFFSNLTRRLSTASSNSVPRVQGNGGICQRRVLNVDPNRQRCQVPEMDVTRLRKVSFCVDVEIAGVARYSPHEEGAPDATLKNAKMKERSEGEALKKPQSAEDEKDDGANVDQGVDVPTVDGKIGKSAIEDDVDGGASPPDGDESASTARKREKKKKSEEERKIRRDNRRRKAEENGSVPVELQPSDEALDASAGSPPPPPAGALARSLDIKAPFGRDQSPAAPVARALPVQGKDRPTTDPVRIYRRCCQLRETPILKRITEQLMNPACIAPYEPGVVNCLDLTGSRLQLADVVTLGDWLAVVPVKSLRMEDADLNDEGVRCVLAGLLAAKRPEPSRRKNAVPRHRERLRPSHYEERSGVVEKLTFKNNPRISRLGWKYISLFLNMCRSIKTIDLSMNEFPATLPPSTNATPVKSPHNVPLGIRRDNDAAEMLFQCLAGRLGGSRLEELAVSECGLTASQVGKIVDGCLACGVSRLGVAGNYLDEEGLQHVMRYLRSGTCQGLDIGGNDLHGKLGMIAEALAGHKELPCWGLSLAGCNLEPSDLRELFPALARLPDFRFIDLSHNKALCERSNDTISLFRRYMSQFTQLKRIHLADVNMSPKQAIAVADCLPDGPRLAHLNILENPQLSALAGAKDEEAQEEACALYASLMAAVRVSSTLICIDIDVPSNDNSEVVKALAKQVVAYSLRNMEQFAIAEATGHTPAANATATAKDQLTGPHGGEQQVKDITVPDVLMHLVGQGEGNSSAHEADEPAPDDDYIVGGTGVVKALQYVLGEKANDLRRSSMPGTPITGAGGALPRPGSSAGQAPTAEQQVKAKKMSINLLGSARKIRTRLQPALAKEAQQGDEMAYRRLMFLDQTLASMIERFEDEYPETRVPKPPGSPRSVPSVSSSITSGSIPRTDIGSSITTQGTECSHAAVSDDEDEAHPNSLRTSLRASSVRRPGSEVSLASRAQTAEEGHLHRLGQHLRREVIDSPASATFPADISWRQKEAEDERIRDLGRKLYEISGENLKLMVGQEGWDRILKEAGANYEDLRRLQEMDPEGWEQFHESQMLARANRGGV